MGFIGKTVLFSLGFSLGYQTRIKNFPESVPEMITVDKNSVELMKKVKIEYTKEHGVKINKID